MLEAFFEKNVLLLQWYPEEVDEAAESLHHEATGLVREKQYARASEKWKHALTLREDDIEYLYKLGLVLFELKQYTESIEFLKKAVEICPIHEKAHLILGITFLKLRNLERAEKHILECKRLNSRNVLAILNLGAVYSIQKQFDAAIKSFEEVIQLNNKETRAFLGLAKIHHLMHDPEKANKNFRKVIELAPNSKIADFAKRSIQMIASQVNEKSDQSLQNQEEQINKGIQYYLASDFKNAAKCYQNYLNFKPGDHYIWYLLGETQIRLGRAHEASDCFKRSVRLNDNRGLYYKSLGMTLYFLGEYEKAVQILKKAIELGKNDPLCHTLLGASLVKTDKLDDASEELTMAYKKIPTNVFALYQLALIQVQKNQKEKAIGFLNRILSKPINHNLKKQTKKMLRNVEA
ncbi:tetratricopeptide repeat protein [candidate division KSB1 bacterium]|nr:tetratricopeptide repeat protein [candidate division KSB1 bacterium]